MISVPTSLVICRHVVRECYILWSFHLGVICSPCPVPLNSLYRFKAPHKYNLPLKIWKSKQRSEIESSIKYFNSNLTLNPYSYYFIKGTTVRFIVLWDFLKISMIYLVTGPTRVTLICSLNLIALDTSLFVV